jgi:tetratricopeptide (TPR) repeat protein
MSETLIRPRRPVSFCHEMQQLNVEEALRSAVAHHQAGQLQQAEQIYRQILAQDQNCAHAWHLLGVVALQVGKFDAAVQMISRAIQLGMIGEAQNNLGEAFRLMGRFKDAAAAFQIAIQQHPNNAEALSNLGLVLNTVGKYSEAKPLLEKAVALKPELANARANYGIALDNTDHLDDAIEQWEIALRLDPNHAVALNNLGVGLQRRKRFERSIATLKKLVEKYPNFAEGHANLGAALAEAGKYEEGIAEGKKAVELEPNRAEAHNSLGVIYMRAKRYEEALVETKRAAEIHPKYVQALGNTGGIYQEMGHYDDAIEWFERAAAISPAHTDTANALYGSYYKIRKPEMSLAITERALQHNPNNAELHGNRSLALLALGRYTEGFEEYEWRWRCGSFTSPPRDFDRPMWEGPDPAGRTILIHAEQGFGDIIQFARYIPMLIALGAKVMVEVPVSVKSLIESIPGVTRVIPKGLKLPDFDMHVPLLSLPRAFKTTLETVPASVPYLRSDESRLEKWRPILQAEKARLKIGLVWGGNLKPDPKRSIPIEQLAPFADIKDAAWFSLQTGDPRNELKDAPAEMNLIDLGKDLKDFSDTAAIMSILDLVVTIDTASAHLGGAVGAKTWTMLHYAPDWRWGMDGETSPWYPTMRLFRQSAPDDWGPVVEKISRELQEM